MIQSKNTPLVSIGMPVHNGDQYIGQALDSLLGQDHKNIELIISDNASTDRTMEICQAYALKDPRICFHKQTSNKGPSDNFNYVLEAASGDYFMWAAADDLWEPNFISTLLKNLLTHANAAISFSGFNNINEKNEEIRSYPHVFELASPRLQTRLRNYLTQEEHLGKANLIYGMMPRSVAQATGGFRPGEKDVWGSDMLLVFRLLSAGDIVFTKEVLFHKRLIPPLPESAIEDVNALVFRTSQLLKSLKYWHGYFQRYARSINTINGLKFQGKVALRLALWRRILGVYPRETWAYLIRPAIRRLLRLFSMLVSPGESRYDR